MVDGKPVRRYTNGTARSKDKGLTSKNSVASSGLECYEVCEETWVEICVGSDDPDDPYGEWCELQEGILECNEVCDYEDDFPDFCDDPMNWYDPGCGGGGGDPDPYPDPAPTPPSIIAVKNQIANKPFSLLPSDIPCNIIQQWLATATHTASQSQIDKLNTIVNTTTVRPGITTTTVARLQDINNAHSTVVNLDYFPVTITQLPKINGQTLTAEQFLAHIRKNINNFVNTFYSEFEPYQWYGLDETVLWNSSNPFGAVIGIDILGLDNGSVIVSQASNDKWTFSTIYDPKYGAHPVSGNRDFGYVHNSDGSYTFYTRGVDRLTSLEATWLEENFYSFPFAMSDNLWSSFQDKILEFVNNNQGTAASASQEIYRPDWQQVTDVLEGKAPLSTLSTDCPD